MPEAFRGLRLYNTLTRAKEDFLPIDPDNVRMYVCGPTVYDYAHIGNARPVIVFDVLFRLLRHLYGEDHVTYVRNITDVEDKINDRARRDFPDLPLNEAIRNVTEKTARQYHEDVKALGCLEPTFEPRATEHIDGMVAMIQTLLDRGHAYVAHGQDGREALFDVLSMPEYGQLSRRRLEDQQAGARIEAKDHKRNPGDFVLWKESHDNEPGWDATFELSDDNRDALRLNSNTLGIRGRPGWHIECSVMSQHHLGKVFDIHGGGLDLIFPHHENEIAQSRCAHGTEVMANYWMHNGFLQVEGRKMSKSEGNFVTIHDLLHTEKFGGRKWPGEVLRLAMLMTHYREPIDFSVRRLEEAEKKLIRWLKSAYLRDEPSDDLVSSSVISHLLDDLSFWPAISDLDHLANPGNASDGVSHASLNATLRFLGLLPAYEIFTRWLNEVDDDTKLIIDARIEDRLAFIREKNWAEADRIRDELLAQGIQLKDGKDPETGERVTTWEVKR
ncbi:cysteine--tRNA ligase [Nitratireductor mangrovi]|uniref:Cysteine--tRNA ligase n=1 Tax=Nitratireductor mangrovi TaxID=2599600 RepID=A0A5B8L606_9HYPH|nr:cysteine--tRNA ligase [Nitratireductor mangrovi]QDZ03130.1 cysteine--tRNA ligase [Nitratireductor mangrovi]